MRYHFFEEKIMAWIAGWLIALCSMTLPIIATANESLVFFDFDRCSTGVAENEPLTGNKTYESWVKTAGKLRDNPQWEVFYTNETKIGMCATSFSKGREEVHCHDQSLNGFELAGAKYSGIRNKAGQLLRFKCSSGCKLTTPKILYRSIESDEESAKGPDEIELLNAYREYDRLCSGK
jgi:hypothetical protein